MFKDQKSREYTTASSGGNNHVDCSLMQGVKITKVNKSTNERSLLLQRLHSSNPKRESHLLVNNFVGGSTSSKENESANETNDKIQNMFNSLN